MVLNTQDKCNLYNTTGINTGNQEMLIMKCYDGVIGCLKKAKDTVSLSDREQISVFNANIVKAQKGIGLLRGALNKEAGEIAENLDKLYTFMIDYLLKASFTKEVKMIDDVIEMMTDLEESWKKAFEKLRAESPAGARLQQQTPQPTASVLNIIG